jgi:hypothetical protein
VSIPLATTTVRVLRPDAGADRDPYDPPGEPSTVAAGVRATISTSSGTEKVAGGSQEVVNFRLACDQYEGGLHHKDTIVDERSGEVYNVVWSVTRNGFGLDHFQAGLQQVSGVVS